MRLFHNGTAFAVCLCGVMLVVGCGEGADHGGMSQTRGGGPGGGGPGGGGPSTRGIKQIMVKLAKGPQSLTPVIGNELTQDPPLWETIQGQTKEYSS